MFLFDLGEEEWVGLVLLQKNQKKSMVCLSSFCNQNEEHVLNNRIAKKEKKKKKSFITFFHYK